MSEAAASKGLEWKWIILGTIVGSIFSVALYLIMSATFVTGTVPTFMSLLGFIVMGIIIGYKSHGYTIKEPAIGGVLTAIITAVVLMKVSERFTPSTTEWVGAPIIGFLFGLLGGWVGEQIQVTPEEAKKELEDQAKGKLQWGWIFAGTIVAFILNAFFVFGLFVVLKFDVGGILFALGASFILAGLITGYFSPGITIREAAAAGAFSMILNFLLIYFGFEHTILPIDYLLGTLVGGFVLSLLGGWLGEKLQSFMEDRIED